MEQCKKIEYANLRELVAKAEGVERDVLNQISLLSLDLFGEDCVEDYSQPGKGGRLWAMYDFGGSFKGDAKRNNNASMASMSTEVSEDEADEDDFEMPEPGFGGRPRLLGFVVARLMNHIRMPKMGGEALSIVFAGVPQELRGKGIGKMITQQVVATGRERKNIAVVTLSALPGAIDFWERCGFVAFPDAMEVKEGMVRGQVYMEANVRGAKGKKGKKTAKRTPILFGRAKSRESSPAPPSPAS